MKSSIRMSSFKFLVNGRAYRAHRAHRAAHPERFPVSDETKGIYPAFKLAEESYKQPTPVHLQVYDGMFYHSAPTSPSIQYSFPKRCSPRPSHYLSLHDSWKILLPCNGFVCQACYDHASWPVRPFCIINTFWGHPNYGPWFHGFPFTAHVAQRDPEPPTSTFKAT
jgi:hypothetical protein